MCVVPDLSKKKRCMCAHCREDDVQATSSPGMKNVDVEMDRNMGPAICSLCQVYMVIFFFETEPAGGLPIILIRRKARRLQDCIEVSIKQERKKHARK